MSQRKPTNLSGLITIRNTPATCGGHSIGHGLNSGEIGYVCVECILNRKVITTCALCKKPISKDHIHESFGDPAEYLCKSCYETVPAKQWEEAVETLNQLHQYDFD